MENKNGGMTMFEGIVLVTGTVTSVAGPLIRYLEKGSSYNLFGDWVSGVCAIGIISSVALIQCINMRDKWIDPYWWL